MMIHTTERCVLGMILDREKSSLSLYLELRLRSYGMQVLAAAYIQYEPFQTSVP